MSTYDVIVFIRKRPDYQPEQQKSGNVVHFAGGRM